MDQLSGPNYKLREVGTLEEDLKRRERMNQDGGVETKRQTWQREKVKGNGKWLIRGEQAIS